MQSFGVSIRSDIYNPIALSFQSAFGCPAIFSNR
jgi:hypothetical protein